MKRRAVGSIKIVVEWVEKGKDSTLVVGMNQDLEVHRASLVHQEAPSVIEKPSHISGVQRTTNQSREIVFFTCRACRVGWHWWQSSVQTYPAWAALRREETLPREAQFEDDRSTHLTSHLLHSKSQLSSTRPGRILDNAWRRVT